MNSGEVLSKIGADIPEAAYRDVRMKKNGGVLERIEGLDISSWTPKGNVEELMGVVDSEASYCYVAVLVRPKDGSEPYFELGYVDSRSRSFNLESTDSSGGGKYTGEQGGELSPTFTVFGIAGDVFNFRGMFGQTPREATVQAMMSPLQAREKKIEYPRESIVRTKDILRQWIASSLK